MFTEAKAVSYVLNKYLKTSFARFLAYSGKDGRTSEDILISAEKCYNNVFFVRKTCYVFG